MQKTLKSKTTCDRNLCVTNAVKATKNSLLLGLDVGLIRAKNYVKDIEKCANNSVADGKKYKKK